MRLSKSLSVGALAALAATCASTLAIYAAGEDRLFPTQTTGTTCEKYDICLADSAVHTVYLDDLGVMDWPTRQTLNSTYNTTEIQVSYQTTKKTSGSWETDVIYELQGLPGDGLGWAWCDDPGGDGSAGSPTDECDQFYLYYDVPRIGDFLGLFNSLGYNFTWASYPAPGQTNGGWFVACHETGHTVGLEHPDQSYPVQLGSQWDYRCMRTNYYNAPSWLDHWLGPQNAAEINNWYYIF